MVDLGAGAGSRPSYKKGGGGFSSLMAEHPVWNRNETARLSARFDKKCRANRVTDAAHSSTGTLAIRASARFEHRAVGLWLSATCAFVKRRVTASQQKCRCNDFVPCGQ